MYWRSSYKHPKLKKYIIYIEDILGKIECPKKCRQCLIWMLKRPTRVRLHGRSVCATSGKILHKWILMFFQIPIGIIGQPLKPSPRCAHQFSFACKLMLVIPPRYRSPSNLANQKTISNLTCQECRLYLESIRARLWHEVMICLASYRIYLLPAEPWAWEDWPHYKPSSFISIFNYQSSLKLGKKRTTVRGKYRTILGCNNRSLLRNFSFF